VPNGLYPPIEPYDQGMLDVGDDNLVYWEACGNPKGKPALVVHGGPGSGCRPGMRRAFDPERYNVILFDQRGCGLSLPNAYEPATDMTCNTTHHLIADMEKLREHLGVERWLLNGASWGSTLILAYAERYPQHVSEIVITAVTMTRRSEVDWLYGQLRHVFPEEWDRFRRHLPEDDRPEGGVELAAAYARLLESTDPAIREPAAVALTAWEDATISLDVNGAPGSYSDRPHAALVARARIVAHYFANAAWLDEDELLRNADRLAGIPGVLIHGRRDTGCFSTPWELSQAWPDAELVVIAESGHSGSAEMTARKVAALDAFATRG
jgi:proline iminopeptidase